MNLIDDETGVSYELGWDLSEEGDSYCFELTEDDTTYYLYESAAEDVDSTLDILTSYLTAEDSVDVESDDIDLSDFLEGYEGHSVIDAFMLSGISPDFETRKYCAELLGFVNYSGTVTKPCTDPVNGRHGTVKEKRISREVQMDQQKITEEELNRELKGNKTTAAVCRLIGKIVAVLAFICVVTGQILLAILLIILACVLGSVKDKKDTVLKKQIGENLVKEALQEVLEDVVYEPFWKDRDHPDPGFRCDDPSGL